MAPTLLPSSSRAAPNSRARHHLASPVLRSSGPPVLRSSGPPVHRSTGPPVHRSTGPPVLRQLVSSMSPLPQIRATTILAVRRNGAVALGGDGQVTVGETVMKAKANKVRAIGDGKLL